MMKAIYITDEEAEAKGLKISDVQTVVESLTFISSQEQQDLVLSNSRMLIQEMNVSGPLISP